MKIPKFDIEGHPFADYIPRKCTHLIVGTFPTHKKNRSFDFFYGSQTNMMWRILLEIFGGRFTYNLDEEAVLERKKFLDRNLIGMTDMLHKCYRKDGSSSDEDIYPIIWNDILSILDENPEIHSLVLTSRTPVWGALGLLETYFIQNGITFDKPRKNSRNIHVGSFKYMHKTISIKVPISPSKKAHDQQRITYHELVAMYRYCLT